jgi:signal transduction histidine kinase
VAADSDAFGILVESAPYGVLTIDERGVVQTCNAAAERMFGCARTDVVGRDLRLLIPVADAGTVEGRRPDGTTFTIDAAFTEFRVGGERRFGVFVRDLGAIGRGEAQLRQSQRLEAMGRLAFGIAHDFNNVLTVISGYSETALAALPQQHPLRSQLAEIRRAGEHAAALTRQLLAFSRRQPLSPRLLDLNEVVLTLEGMLARLLGAGVTIRHRLDPASPVVTADLAQLEQVIVTLALNARDAMPTGGRLTFATCTMAVDDDEARTEGIPPGRFALLTVSDTGPGIPAELIGQVFEPFLAATGASSAGGLALATAHGVVAQSGGHLTVSSRADAGTEFRVYLPIADRASPATPGSPALRGTETILVVEDDPSLRRLTVLYLQASGYTVRAAGLGAEALVEAGDGAIDLLVTDMVLPDMSGEELAAHLRGRHPSLGVLFTSGYPEAAVHGHRIAGPGQHFLQKPFAPSALGQAVRALLEAARPPT